MKRAIAISGKKIQSTNAIIPASNVSPQKNAANMRTTVRITKPTTLMRVFTMRVPKKAPGSSPFLYLSPNLCHGEKRVRRRTGTEKKWYKNQMKFVIIPSVLFNAVV